VLRALADLGVQNLTVTPPSLEELFLRHYGDRPAEPAAPGGTGRGAGRDVRAPR
jgi:ABC-2 type transport system ATP-binding protein